LHVFRGERFKRDGLTCRGFLCSRIDSLGDFAARFARQVASVRKPDVRVRRGRQSVLPATDSMSVDPTARIVWNGSKEECGASAAG
jgi:hypothetical protein